ncbi:MULTISPECIES: hypothetical protein [unclassified Streptomyces]|uniref:hypothetical protein n=1 Tax=unclassified Streptomyces TaxID=2593676 RepID=UPI0036EB3771
MIDHNTAPGLGRAATAPFAGLVLCPAIGFSLPSGQAGPVFEQDLWDFSQVLRLPAHTPKGARILDFTTVRNPSWRTLAKEYVTALLPGHARVRELPDAVRTPHTLQTAKLKFREVVRWLNWLTAHGSSISRRYPTTTAPASWRNARGAWTAQER